MSAIVDMRRTEGWFERRNKKRREWMRGDEDVLRFLDAFGEFIETWDDLVDEDKKVSKERLNNAIFGFIMNATLNPFVASNQNFLAPMMIHCFNAWLDSEEMKNDPERKNRELAFHLRNYPLELYQLCAFLVGGMEHLRAVSPEMRRFFCIEEFEEWEHANV